MKIYLKDGNYTLAKDFPMSVFEIRDTLDRLRKFQSRGFVQTVRIWKHRAAAKPVW